MSTTVIIGAGVSGLAAAILMRRAGHEVTVLEKSDGPGGKMGELRMHGFRFDTGPSLFTWPHLLEELLPPDPGAEPPAWERLDPISRYFWDHGLQLDAHADARAFALEIEDKLGLPSQDIMHYLQESQALFEIIRPVFLEQNPSSFSKLFTKRTWKALHGLPKLRAWQSLHRYNTQFLKHPAIVQLFDRYATYNGSNPYVAPATLRVIAHLEHNDGAFFPREGMHSIATKLYQAALKAGVSFHFRQDVTQLQLTGQKVIRVTAGDRSYPLDHLISTIDIRQFYQILPNRSPVRLKSSHEALSSSAITFFWGMQREYPGLTVHNVFFSNDYRKEFEHLFNKGILSDDLTIYVYISAKKNREDAPEGQENWFVMVNAPPDAGQDWERIIPLVRAAILKRLEFVLGESIEKNIISETYRGPLDLERQSGTYRGAIYGSHSNGIFSAFQRHPNHLKRINNLAFAGGTVHPGGGIPLCLLSARMATDHFLSS